MYPFYLWTRPYSAPRIRITSFDSIQVHEIIKLDLSFRPNLLDSLFASLAQFLSKFTRLGNLYGFNSISCWCSCVTSLHIRNLCISSNCRQSVVSTHLCTFLELKSYGWSHLLIPSFLDPVSNPSSYASMPWPTRILFSVPWARPPRLWNGDRGMGPPVSRKSDSTCTSCTRYRVFTMTFERMRTSSCYDEILSMFLSGTSCLCYIESRLINTILPKSRCLRGLEMSPFSPVV